jgi:predicted ATPase
VRASGSEAFAGTPVAFSTRSASGRRVWAGPSVSIHDLSIKGFRSLRDVTWRPGKLNVLIGPNGSGKSNLLQAIALLREAATGGLSEAILRMGGLGPLLWDGRVQELAWVVRVDPLDEALGQEQLVYELRLRQLGTTSSYRIEEERLSVDDAGQGSKNLLERLPDRAVIMDGKGAVWEVLNSLPEERTALSSSTPYSSFRRVGSFNDLLRGWSLYHDVRIDPGAPLRQAAVARIERRIAPEAQNLVPVLHTLYSGSREFKRVVDDAMRAAFNSDYEELVFPPAADQRVQLRVRWRSLRTEQSIADLSDGTIRFLLLIAVLASPDPPSLIALDEPEMGLHPSMLPIVAELATNAAKRTQVIFTTHSAQLLDAFTSTPPTTTIAKWEDGETRLSVLDGEELARWLQDYTLGALFRSGELEGMA